ncbi:lipopolysaccharide biosynthesis protein [Photobacterium leiognathi]|nr:oligosaccharide flippase family protein [Photobacterium leiognathi]
MGSASAQLITIAMLPILSRIIDPKILGQYSISTISVMILYPIFCGRMDQALLASENDNKNELLNAGLRFNLIFIVLSIVIIILLSFIIDQKYIFSILLTLFAISSFSISQLISSHSLSEGDFGCASKHRFIRTTTTILIQIVLCYFSTNLYSMLISYISANLISVLFFNSITDKKLVIYVEFNSFKKIIKRKKDFILYQNISYAFSMASQYIMNYSFVYFSNTITLGLYSMMTRVMQAPITLVSSSIKDAFYYKAKKISNRKLLRKELIKITFTLLTLSLIVSIIFFNHLPYLFESLFGIEWKEAGVYAQILTPWFILMFLNQPYSAVANIIGIQKVIMKFDILSFLMRLIVIVSSWLIYNDVYITLYAFSVLGVLLNISLMYLIYKRCK